MSTIDLAASATTVLAADDVFGMFGNLTSKTGTLVGEATAVVAMIFVLRHIIQSFTVVRLITALALGGLMIWGVLHLQDISDKADRTINEDGGGSSGTPGGTGGTTAPPTTVQLGAGQFQLHLPDVSTPSAQARDAA